MTPEQLRAMARQLDPAQVAQVAAQLGIDPAVADQIIEQVMPAIMAGMAGNAQADAGANRLNAALDANHDGSILDDLAGYLGHANWTDGAKILGHVFGVNQQAIAQQIADRLGLDVATVNSALVMLAPVVMGQLGRQRKAGDFDASQLAGLAPVLDQMLGGDLGALFGGQG